MTAVLMISIVSTAALVILLHAHQQHHSFADTTALGATSPIDHAERILDIRLARGQITSEEYARMVAVLRR